LKRHADALAASTAPALDPRPDARTPRRGPAVTQRHPRLAEFERALALTRASPRCTACTPSVGTISIAMPTPLPPTCAR
jgi:hypothetical protein